MLRTSLLVIGCLGVLGCAAPAGGLDPLHALVVEVQGLGDEQAAVVVLHERDGTFLASAETDAGHQVRFPPSPDAMVTVLSPAPTTAAQSAFVHGAERMVFRVGPRPASPGTPQMSSFELRWPREPALFPEEVELHGDLPCAVGYQSAGAFLEVTYPQGCTGHRLLATTRDPEGLATAYAAFEIPGPTQTLVEIPEWQSFERAPLRTLHPTSEGPGPILLLRFGSADIVVGWPSSTEVRVAAGFETAFNAGYAIGGSTIQLTRQPLLKGPDGTYEAELLPAIPVAVRAKPRERGYAWSWRWLGETQDPGDVLVRSTFADGSGAWSVFGETEDFADLTIPDLGPVGLEWGPLAEQAQLLVHSRPGGQRRTVFNEEEILADGAHTMTIAPN
ncbi:MAG: hypothetical protein U1E65_04850 [Myxococcota bacterium]